MLAGPVQTIGRAELAAAVKKHDPTRLVTSGSTNKEGLDVIGINGGSESKSFFERRFDRPFVSTEAPHTWQTRGYYRTQTWWRDGPKGDTFELPNITEKEIFFYVYKMYFFPICIMNLNELSLLMQ